MRSVGWHQSPDACCTNAPLPPISPPQTLVVAVTRLDPVQQSVPPLAQMSTGDGLGRGPEPFPVCPRNTTVKIRFLDASRRKLFSELGQVCDLGQQNLCTAQVEEMEPAIRYCTYQIGRQGGTTPGVDALLRLGELDGRGTTEELQAQLSALAQESQAAAEASSVSIEWAGVRHTARHDKVKAALLQAGAAPSTVCLLASLLTARHLSARGCSECRAGATLAHQGCASAQQHAASLDAATTAAAAAASSSTATPMDSEGAAATSTPGSAPAASAAPPSAVDARVSLYDRMIASYADAKAQLRAVQTSLLGGDEDPQAAELASLEAAITATSLQRVIDRTTLLVADTERRFGAALDATATGKRLKDKGQFSKAEEVVRLYDTLCRNYEDLGDLGARQGGRQGEELYALCAARVAAAQALRCYYIAHAYLGSDKALEAHALFVRAGERAASGQERLQEVGLPSEGIARLAIQAAAYRTVALTELLAESVCAREAVEAGVGGIALSDPQQTGGSGGAADTSAASGKAAAKPARYLSDHMDAWESFAGAAGGKGACIYNAPYSIQAIPVRPIMLDTASNYITYPSLEHRLRKTEKKGIMASLFGTWGAARS
ncbi:MAG: hypothetical protein WDW38_000109 [Sanguina aurantia]